MTEKKSFLGEVWSKISILIFFAGIVFLVYTYTDFGFLRSEITVYYISYPNECYDDSGNLISEKILKRKCTEMVAWPPVTYKINKENQTVILNNSNASGGLRAFVGIKDCAIIDRKNWQCTDSSANYMDNDVRPITWVIGFRDGKYFDSRNEPMGKFVSRFEWFRHNKK